MMDTYRGMLLVPVIARAMSRARRKKLVGCADGWAAPMQWAGRTGLSIEALAIHCQSKQAMLCLGFRGHQRCFL